MPRPKFKDRKGYKTFYEKRKPKGPLRGDGQGPDEMNFEDQTPKDIKAGYDNLNKDYAPGFAKRAYRDLVFGQVTTKINPQAEAGEQADPYAIIGPTRRVIDAKYRGQDNENGNVCLQLSLGSGSNFSDMPDFISETVYVNYNYCKHTEDDNASPNCNKSYYYPWIDVDTTIQSEAFYDLPFFGWTVSTEVDPATDPTKDKIYYQDGLLDIVDLYQITLQAVYQIPLRYKVIRSLEKELKDMCYHNGDDIMNEIYGRLKKAVFINSINGFSECISGHYLDKAWLEDTALLMAEPCKKADGMLDPLIELNVRYKYNKNLIVKDKNNNILFKTSSSDFSDLFDAIDYVLDNMSIEHVLTMARTNASYSDIQTWMNNIIDKCTTIKSKMKIFTSHFADLVVAFKRMAKAGYTNWELGQFLLVSDINEKYQPRFNKMVYDILRSTFTGAKNITYTASINQWLTYFVWDKYLGIPTYDEKQGGSILTFSTKVPVNASGLALPFAAWFQFKECNIITRLGNKYGVTKEDLDLSDSATARILGRLSPLSTLNSTVFMVPGIDLTSISANPIKQSWIVEMMQHVFGYCKAYTHKVGNVKTPDYNISDDILTAVDGVVADLTNAIDTQARIDAPFRVLKATKVKVLGVER